MTGRKETAAAGVKTIRNGDLLRLLALTAGLLFILAVFPFRVFVTYQSFAVPSYDAEVSGEVSDTRDAGARFIAAYEHLHSLTVPVTDLDRTGTLYCNLFDVSDPSVPPVILADEYLDVKPSDFPAEITFPMDVDLVPGQEYLFILTTTRECSCHVLFAQENAGEEQPEISQSIYYDSAVAAKKLVCGFTYRIPVGKIRSLTYMGIAALLSLAAVILLTFLSNTKGKAGRFLRTGITYRQAAQRVFIPLIVAAALWLSYLIAVRKAFDYRITDILLYLAGTWLAAGIACYGLLRRQIFVPAPYTEDRAQRIRHVLIMIALAFAFGFACEYMNGLYDIFHMVAQRKMLIALLLSLLFTFRAREFRSPAVLLWTAASAAAGFVYYRMHALDAAQKEYQENNFVLASLMVIVVLAGTALFLTVKALVKDRSEHDPVRWLIVPACAFSGMMIIFRNTRWWPVVLVLIWLLFALRLRTWEDRKLWLRDVAGGVTLHFAAMVLYCLRHRLYMAFIFTRFSMNFHTVTVTAVYLTMVECVAVSLLLTKARRVRRSHLRFGDWINVCFPELVYVGTASSYLVFTMSRTGVAAAAAVVFVLLAAAWLVMTVNLEERPAAAAGKCALYAASMLMSLMLLIVPAFTMQRIVPALSSDPKVFELELPYYHTEVLRGDRYDSMFYICIERFVQVFRVKFLGLPEGDYDYYHHWDWLKDQEAETAGTENAASLPETEGTGAGTENAGAQENVSGTETTPEQEPSSEEEEALNDYSNGRMAIFRQYAKSLDMKGHDRMGVEMENGEVMVHAHNIYLQTAYDHGIPTGVLFVILLVCTAIRSLIYYNKNCKNAWLPACLPLAAAAGFAVTGLVEWVFHLCNPMSLLFLLCLTALFEREQDERQRY